MVLLLGAVITHQREGADSRKDVLPALLTMAIALAYLVSAMIQD
jgi:hypothetical protein